MNQFLPLTLVVRILAAKDSETVTLERRALVPFLPGSGVKIRLYNDEDDAAEFELADVVYDTRLSTFISELEDSDARDAYHAGEVLDIKELEKWYISFGFVRNYRATQYPTT